MAQPPGQRGQVLNRFFSTQHGFEPESYNQVGIIVYKRRNAQNLVERIVVKHALAPADSGEAYDLDDRISHEENILRRLWGAEHVVRLLAVVDNQRHRSRKWNEPLSRPFHYLWTLLPWRLRANQAIYPWAIPFNFIVMEHLSRGDGIVHGDLHLGNMMFGEYDPIDGALPLCHQGVPLIDFGLAWDEWTPRDAQQDNIRYVGECIHQLALVGVDDFVYNDDRPTFLVDDIPTLAGFETYLEEEFYRSERFSRPFRQLLAWCMAVEQNNRPSVRRALLICERNVGRGPSWEHLADEISDIYDMVPMDTDDSSGSEYDPAASNSDYSG
ncbi:hypothetical protein GQX73_g1958 [Xylaria multiplex]|uniref:Protein kinase domain-containing protein n=1 Tax=Xylaria multiplex TaxID=323545 RepID=A0A7C8J1H3_9PEZI|nr:hypothetical protein GQX73_g1958 [Xylaria multiplex]